jgi:hypothetical protein
VRRAGDFQKMSDDRPRPIQLIGGQRDTVAEVCATVAFCCLVLAVLLAVHDAFHLLDEAARFLPSVEADMLVSRGNMVDLYLNDWDHPPERVPVAAGERHVYRFTHISRDIHLLRFDPTDVPGARIVIYGITVKLGNQPFRRFGPAELRNWELHNLSAPEEENGALVLLDTNDDPILVGRPKIQLPEGNSSAQPSFMYRAFMYRALVMLLVAMGLVWVSILLSGRRGLLIVRDRLLAMLNKGRNRSGVLILVWALACLAILPAIFHWEAPPPYTDAGRYLPIGLGYLIAVSICYVIFRAELRRLSRPQALSLVFVIFLLTSITNNLHGFNVDQATNYFPEPNRVWQERTHNLVMQLAPALLPHSYRFLPNSIVRWVQLAHLDFDSARDLYRLIAGLLLFYSIYKYARLYSNYTSAIVAMLLTAAIYPISFEHYAGQLTDPLSHLSFVLAFIFLETEEFALLLSTLVIGSLAKETVLALAGYYVLFCQREARYQVKAVSLCVASAGVYFGVRLFVLHGSMNYQQTSGVKLEHVLENWQFIGWHEPFLLTACALLPFLALGWKETALSLKRLVFFLFPVLFLSSLFFSWLVETRNFMPLVFVLSVVAAGYFGRFPPNALKTETAPETDGPRESSSIPAYRGD